MRIGVVADTHVGEPPARPPAEVLERLDGVDLIVHAGDVAQTRRAGRAARGGPVAAVRGNHDRGALRHLPLSLRGARPAPFRIGVTHGTAPPGIELPSGLLSVAAGRPVLLGFARQMARRFTGVDMVVTGHLHLSFDHVVDGVRHFSPGAVFVNEMLTGRVPTSGPRRVGVPSLSQAHPRRRPAAGDRLRGGGPGGLTVRRVVLERPIAVQRRPSRRRRRR